MPTCSSIALDLAQDRVERMLAARGRSGSAASCAARRGSRGSARAPALALPVPAAQVLRDVLAREDRLGDVVEQHVLGLYQRCAERRPERLSDVHCSISRQIASVNSVVDARAAEIARADRARPSSTRVERRADALGRARRSPMWSSISSAESSSAVGLARFLSGDVRRAAVHRLEHRRSRSPRFAAPARRRGRRPGRRTDPTRCRRTGSAAAARRTARDASPAACTRRRRSARRR